METTVSILDGHVPWRYEATRMPTCFHSAEYGVSIAEGEFVCFPSDDSYYVPVFGERMLQEADKLRMDLVMCDMLYDPRCGHGRYCCVDQHPRRGWFDKTGFILRRSQFIPFPNKITHAPRIEPILECADGLFAEELVARGVRWAEIRDVLVVHN